jgi:tRNA threonylcarbamoyladenosine biosynthesis protein TsaE
METHILEIGTKSHQETFSWGKRLSTLLNRGDVVALYGALGSGKTVFAQGICAGLDVQDYVTSPSFTLIQEYEGRIPVYHFDFYRLESLEQVETLDIDGYMMAGGLCIIEWAEKGEPLLPHERFSVTLKRFEEKGKHLGDERLIRIEAPMGRSLSELQM